MKVNRNQLLGLAGAACLIVAFGLVLLAGADEFLFDVDRLWWWHLLVSAGLALVALGHFTPPKVHR